MSKLFYDHLIVLEEVEAEIKKTASTQEEKEELWGLIDEIIHHRVMEKVLDRLPRKLHEDFLSRFHQAPHDESLMDYLTEQIGENVEEIIRQEVGELAYELLKDLRKK
jgi:hypothetical protein